MAGPQSITYKAEPADQRLIEPLDSMTLIYQRRSGLTHIVAEPVPEILAAMAEDALDAAVGCSSGWHDMFDRRCRGSYCGGHCAA